MDRTPLKRRERRSCVRVVPAEGSLVSRVRLRTGDELIVLDIGIHGAQVEGPARLLPGRLVDLQVPSAHGRMLVRALVVRSQVAAVDAEAVTYRSGLAFERPIALAPSEAA